MTERGLTRGMTTMIAYRGEVAAFAGPTRVVLAPWLEDLPTGDPDLRMVAFMALYSRELREGRLDGPYDDADAELFARCALMPDEEFQASAGRPDEDLAEHFRVPVEQVRARRIDLGASRDGNL